MAGTAVYSKSNYPNAAQSTLNILNKQNGSGTNVGTAQDAIKADLAGQASARASIDDYYTNNPPKGTGSSSGSGASAGAVAGGGFDLVGYLEGLRAQQRADAEAAYARAKAQISAGYDDAIKGYGETLSSGQRQLGRSYDNSRGKINQEATDAFQQAYINRMLSEKNLTQRLAAMGMSGGASESTMAGLINNYGNARNGIQRTLDTNLGDLEMNYQNNLDKLISSYNEQVNNLRTVKANQLANLEAQLASLNANMGGDYYSMLMSNQGLLKNAMQNAVAAQAAYSAPVAQEVTNTFNPANIQQANDVGGTKTNWAKSQLEDYIANQRANNVADSIIRQTLYNQGYAPADLFGYF